MKHAVLEVKSLQSRIRIAHTGALLSGISVMKQNPEIKIWLPLKWIPLQCIADYPFVTWARMGFILMHM